MGQVIIQGDAVLLNGYVIAACAVVLVVVSILLLIERVRNYK